MPGPVHPPRVALLGRQMRDGIVYYVYCRVQLYCALWPLRPTSCSLCAGFTACASRRGIRLVKGFSNSSLRRPSRVFARVPAIRPCLARTLPDLHEDTLTHRLHVFVQVRCRSRKTLKNGRDQRSTLIVNLVDSRRSAGDLSRSSGGHGHERSATPGRPSIDPPCILDPLPARF